MRHVLFVDDEPRILQGLENMMFPYMDRWDMDFALSGLEALDIIDRSHVDVLVTDMRMPEMDGAELLDRVREQHPEVVRVVLTGHSELYAARRAMSMAHRFLSKPCDAKALIDVIEETSTLLSLLHGTTVREAVTRQENLPARPSSFSKIQQVLASDDWQLADVIDIVSHDAAIATRVVQVANTAFFSRGREITSVADAVPRIGAKYVGELVLAFEVFGAFSNLKKLDVEGLHERGFRTGQVARALLDGPDAQDAFLAGLVHDIGKLVMAVQLPDYTERVLCNDEDTYATEIALYGTSHAAVGAYHLGLWGLPTKIVAAVASHHWPDPARGFGLAAALFVASELIDAIGEGREPSFDPNLLQALGITDRIDDFRHRALDALHEVS